MSPLEPVTPSPFQLMLSAGDLADPVRRFSPWDLNHATGERCDYRGHQAILRLLKLLVDPGYLTRDFDTGGRDGHSGISVDRQAGTVSFINQPLGDEPRHLQLLERRLRDRGAAAVPAA